MERSQIQATVDFDRPGKQYGHVCVPYSYDLGGWANLLVPVAVLANGPGRTALVLAGNHGDEYPGQVAILKLLRELRPEQVRGRLILIPTLNQPACRAATRLSPVDGKNMNRAFPGRADGTVTEMIAHYLTTVLFPLADVVIDIHTGGRSLDFLPCATMHLVPDRQQRRQMAKAALAFNSDFAFLYADIAGTGLLPVEAERQGKVVVTTEMGGGETVPAAVHRLTQGCLRNVLIHLGLLTGEKKTRRGLGLPPTRWVQALSRDDYRFAPESGVWESLVDLGAEVAVGQPLGQVHFLERPDREPEAVTAATAGVVLALRAPSRVAQGDCVACVTHEVDPGVLE
jgi:N-alpha-acetyl-L-2,4-diaminobutyrate deacetylase